MWILTILSKLKLQHFLVIALLGLGAFSMWALGEIKFQKSEKNRQLDNYENLRDKDSLKVAILNFRTNAEMEDYIDSNKDLNDLLEQQNIKLKRANNIIYQKQKYIDNLERSTDVSNLVESIRNNVSAKTKWSDSTACLVVRGNVEYKNDSLAVNVTERQFDNKIAIVGGWERNQKNLWTRWFGRKKAVVTATSKCGESETVIIEKQKK